MKLRILIKKYGLVRCIVNVLCTPIYLVLREIFIILCRKSDIKENLIVFSSLPDYSDNSKALYEYMISENEKYSNCRYIWFVERIDKEKMLNDENTTFVKTKSYFHKGLTFKAIYYIYRANIVFFTHGFPFKSFKKRSGQLIINLWHGCGYKDTQKNKKKYIEENPFDYALVPGDVFIKTKSKFWGCDESQILNIGYPRYDSFFKKDEKIENYIKIINKNNSKMIVWMPTFRKTINNLYPEEKVDRNFEIPLLESQEQLIELNDFCYKSNVVLFIKRHPFQIEYESEKMNLSNIVFLSNQTLKDKQIDLYSLLGYTDGLITDYSSIAIDYLLLDKPIGFTLDDFDSYKKSRGFVFENPKEYMPGHHIYNYDDMIEFIKQICSNRDLYAQKRKNIIGKVHNKCDNYCARILHVVKELKNNL